MMPGDERWWRLLPAPVRRVPADLAATAGLTLLAALVIFLPVVRESPVRQLLWLGFVLFVPGYAVTAALFPEAGGDTDEAASPAITDGETAGRRGIDGVERAALAFGTSVAIVPLVGLALNFTPWGIRLVPLVGALCGFTVAATVVATRRRWATPSEDRFRVPYRDWLAAGRTAVRDPPTRTDGALNVLLVFSLLVAAGSVGYAVTVPPDGAGYTAVYIATEEADGDLVAADYPTEFVRGASKSLVVGVRNREHRPVTYTMVVELQRVRVTNTTPTVLAATELDRFTLTASHNETVTRPLTVSPTMTGTRLRLAFLLYRDDVPQNPTVDNAYRELHLWINVSRPGG